MSSYRGTGRGYVAPGMKPLPLGNAARRHVVARRVNEIQLSQGNISHGTDADSSSHTGSTGSSVRINRPKAVLPAHTGSKQPLQFTRGTASSSMPSSSFSSSSTSEEDEEEDAMSS